MVFYEPDKRDRDLLPHDPFKAFIAPRPIGWVSTVSASGAVNLAPYSYFNAVCDTPPTVMFSSNGAKDSMTFAHETGEFVWNMATWDLREPMNLSSADLPRGESEFVHAGLELAPSRLVAPPRVAAAPVSLECKVTQVVQIDDGPNIVTFGRVVGVHLDEASIVLPVRRCSRHSSAISVRQLRRRSVISPTPTSMSRHGLLRTR